MIRCVTFSSDLPSFLPSLEIHDKCVSITGDEAVSARMKREPYRLIDEDARDEGADYEGECSVVTVVAKEVKAMKREESTTKLIEVRTVSTSLSYTECTAYGY